MGHPHDRQPTAGIISLTSMEARKLTRDIGLLPANTRYRLVGKANPHLVEKGGTSERSRAAEFKQSVQ